MTAVRCCTGAALGSAHSPSCMWDASENAEKYLAASAEIRAHLNESRRLQGEHWREERARNLREQRRYEVSRDIFVCLVEGDPTIDHGQRLARHSLRLADEFIEELERQA